MSATDLEEPLSDPTIVPDDVVSEDVLVTSSQAARWKKPKKNPTQSASFRHIDPVASCRWRTWWARWLETRTRTKRNWRRWSATFASTWTVDRRRGSVWPPTTGPSCWSACSGLGCCTWNGPPCPRTSSASSLPIGNRLRRASPASTR